LTNPCGCSLSISGSQGILAPSSALSRAPARNRMKPMTALCSRLLLSSQTISSIFSNIATDTGVASLLGLLFLLVHISTWVLIILFFVISSGRWRISARAAKQLNAAMDLFPYVGHLFSLLMCMRYL